MSAPQTSFPSAFIRHPHPQVLEPGISNLGEEFLIALPIIFAFYVIFFLSAEGDGHCHLIRQFISCVYRLKFAFSL